MKRILSGLLSGVIIVNLLISSSFSLYCQAAEKKGLLDNIKAKVEDIFENTSEKAKGVTENVVGKTKSTGMELQDRFSTIDTSAFEKGWETASEYTSSSIAAISGKKYVSEVQNAIQNMKNDINSEAGITRSIASESGFVAEKWHTGTYNIDAVANGSHNTAKQLESNGLASVDVELSDGTKASMKYYKEGSMSAKEQAKTIMQQYQEYYVKESAKGTENIMTIDDYIDKNFKGKKAQECYKSVYDGQIRIIPTDQMDEASAYLKKKIAKESVKEGQNRQALSESYQETLDSLADRLQSKDGTKSKPLTKEESQAIAELCEKGEFEPEDFGIKTSAIITPKYILKQSIGAGVQAAALQAALEVGPEVYAIIKAGIESGDIDEKQIQQAGMSAAIAGSEGFVEGSVSNALLVACKSGKLGTELIDVSPQTIGTLTVLTIDAVCYGHQLNQGLITAEQYGNIMTEEIFVALVSQTSGVLFMALLPMIPLSYMIGSMAGGMLASAAYEQGKQIVMEVKGEGGFEIIVPTTVKEGTQVGKDIVSNIKIDEKLASAQNIAISTTKQGTIFVQQTMDKITKENKIGK